MYECMYVRTYVCMYVRTYMLQCVALHALVQYYTLEADSVVVQELSREKGQKTQLTNDLVKVKEDYRKSLIFLETGDWEDKVKEDKTRETKYVSNIRNTFTQACINMYVHACICTCAHIRSTSSYSYVRMYCVQLCVFVSSLHLWPPHCTVQTH